MVNPETNWYKARILGNSSLVSQWAQNRNTLLQTAFLAILPTGLLVARQNSKETLNNFDCLIAYPLTVLQTWKDEKREPFFFFCFCFCFLFHIVMTCNSKFSILEQKIILRLVEVVVCSCSSGCTTAALSILYTLFSQFFLMKNDLHLI